jgi:hypothetical protein
MMVTKVLAEGKGDVVRCRLKEAEVQSYEPTAEIAYKAQSPGKLAQHKKA